jgi:hypothetical protein
MSRAIPLLPLWAFGACYRANLTFFYIVFEMFWTINCLSSGGLYKQLYCILSCIYISSLVAVRMWYETHADDGWFFLHMYIRMHGSENVKYLCWCTLLNPVVVNGNFIFFSPTEYQYTSYYLDWVSVRFSMWRLCCLSWKRNAKGKPSPVSIRLIRNWEKPGYSSFLIL